MNQNRSASQDSNFSQSQKPSRSGAGQTQAKPEKPANGWLGAGVSYADFIATCMRSDGDISLMFPGIAGTKLYSDRELLEFLSFSLYSVRKEFTRFIASASLSAGHRLSLAQSLAIVEVICSRSGAETDADDQFPTPALRFANTMAVGRSTRDGDHGRGQCH